MKVAVIDLVWQYPKPRLDKPHGRTLYDVILIDCSSLVENFLDDLRRDGDILLDLDVL